MATFFYSTTPKDHAALPSPFSRIIDLMMLHLPISIELKSESETLIKTENEMNYENNNS